MLTSVNQSAPLSGGTVARTLAWNVVFRNGTVRLKVSVASSRRYPDGSGRWRVALLIGAAANFVVRALMDPGNDRASGCFLPRGQGRRKSLYLPTRSLQAQAASRFPLVAALFGSDGEANAGAGRSNTRCCAERRAGRDNAAMTSSSCDVADHVRAAGPPRAESRQPAGGAQALAGRPGRCTGRQRCAV